MAYTPDLEKAFSHFSVISFRHPTALPSPAPISPLRPNRRNPNPTPNLTLQIPQVGRVLVPPSNPHQPRQISAEVSPLASTPQSSYGTTDPVSSVSSLSNHRNSQNRNSTLQVPIHDGRGYGIPRRAPPAIELPPPYAGVQSKRSSRLSRFIVPRFLSGDPNISRPIVGAHPCTEAERTLAMHRVDIHALRDPEKRGMAGKKSWVPEIVRRHRITFILLGIGLILLIVALVLIGWFTSHPPGGKREVQAEVGNGEPANMGEGEPMPLPPWTQPEQPEQPGTPNTPDTPASPESSPEDGDESTKNPEITFPELPTGSVSIIPLAAAKRDASCLKQTPFWSCTLPTDSTFPHHPHTLLPEFQFVISHINNNPAARSPNPAPPSDKDYSALASIDKTNSPSVPAPYTITLKTNSTGGKDASQLFPLLIQNQPLRLFDGDTENPYYGFHTYYNKTIQFLSKPGVDYSSPPNNREGGLAAHEANVVVTWHRTRLRVAIYLDKEEGKKEKRHESGVRVTVWEDREEGDGEGADRRVLVQGEGYGDEGHEVKESREEGGKCGCEWRN